MDRLHGRKGGRGGDPQRSRRRDRAARGL